MEAQLTEIAYELHWLREETFWIMLALVLMFLFKDMGRRR